MQSVIIGYGEIGKAVGDFFDIPDFIDLNQSRRSQMHYDYMHVAIPWSKTFVQDVSQYIYEIEPQLTIVHSTIPLGTTRKLMGPKVHFPVRGRHTNLAKGIKDYEAFIGYNSIYEKRIMEEYLDGLGMEVTYCKGYECTEGAKLLSLLQYGMNIEFARYAKEICDRWNISYTQSVKLYTESYNDGILEDNPQLVKTILDPPSGEIGGHCVLPAIKILNENDPSKILKSILERNDEERNTKNMGAMQHLQNS